MSRLASTAAPALSDDCFSRSRVVALTSDQLSRTLALMPPSAPGLAHSSCLALLDGSAPVDRPEADSSERSSPDLASSVPNEALRHRNPVFDDAFAPELP